MSDEPFKLNDGEQFSPTAQKIKKYLESELESLRRQNDSLQCTEVQTAALRGRIAAVKKLLDAWQKN